MDTINLNGVWHFGFAEKRQLEEICEHTFCCTEWINVPGCFDTLPAYCAKRGTGVYRREFTLESSCRNAFLRVEGMGLRCRFSIDGKIIGSSQLAYSTFELETGALSSGKHLLEAAVDNVFDPEKVKLFRPNYDFYAFGGFYHGVSLRLMKNSWAADRIHVRTTDWKKGIVRLSFLLYGEAPEEFRAAVAFDDGKPEEYEVKGRELTLPVPDFRLWSPEEPNLHTLTVTLNGETVSETFGIRDIRTEKGHILLNGKDLYLKGFNRHEATDQTGSATDTMTMLRDLQHLKELNCNFVRGAHYPQSQQFLDLCDRMGLLVWEESLGWGNEEEQCNDPVFRELQVEQARLMVKNSFNHPSVIIFAFMNENHSETKGGAELDRILCETIRKEDSGRLITFACNRVTGDLGNRYTDIIAYNTYPGWITDDYTLDPMDFIVPDRKKILEYFRTHFDPEKPIIISEMGTCAVYGQHDAAGAQWTEEFQREYLENVIHSAFEEPEIRGLCIWQMNDARSFLRIGSNIRGKPFAQNLAGVYDTFRRPKLAAESVRKLFAKKGE